MVIKLVLENGAGPDFEDEFGYHEPLRKSITNEGYLYQGDYVTTDLQVRTLTFRGNLQAA